MKTNHMNQFWKKLAATFEIRGLGNPKKCLGIEVNHVSEQQCVALTQRAYILELAAK